MTNKLITWVDRQGRYRIVTPAYNDGARPAEETESQCLERVWARLVAVGGYGIPLDHPHHYVDEDILLAKITACGGNDLRYPGKPDSDGRRDAKGGAWEMDLDGTPKVNMVKARGVYMDRIRVARDAELAALDVPYIRAVETGDSEAQTAIGTMKQLLRDIPQTFDLTAKTPSQLKNLWPNELPRE